MTLFSIFLNIILLKKLTFLKSPFNLNTVLLKLEGEYEINIIILGNYETIMKEKQLNSEGENKTVFAICMPSCESTFN